jgi:hypothetical protein
VRGLGLLLEDFDNVGKKLRLREGGLEPLQELWGSVLANDFDV